MFVRGKAGIRAEFNETSDTVDQRKRQHCSQKQVIYTSRSVDTSQMDEFRQPGKRFEWFDNGPSCGVSRKRAFSKDLFGEVGDTKVAESGSGTRIPGCGDEVQTGTEVEFTDEVSGQVKQEIYRAALSEYENGDIKKILTEQKVIKRSVESCGPVEHHAMEKDFVLSPESEELNDEQSDDD